MSRIRHFFKSFCDNTTIHGFKYVGGNIQTHKLGKLFWCLSLVVSTVLCVVAVRNLLLQIMRNPTVIYIDNNATFITDINFPAVTICPSLKLGFGGFNDFDYIATKKNLISGVLQLKDLTEKQ